MDKRAKRIFVEGMTEQAGASYEQVQTARCKKDSVGEEQDEHLSDQKYCFGCYLRLYSRSFARQTGRFVPEIPFANGVLMGLYPD